MKRLLVLGVIAPLVFGGVVLATQDHEKENICHKTSSESHPWEAINIDVNNDNHDDHEEDFPYEGPVKDNGKPTKDGNQWCEDNVPTPPEEEEPEPEKEEPIDRTPVNEGGVIESANTFVGGGK